MRESTKQSSTTRRQSQREASPLEQAFLAQQKLLEQVVLRQQAMLEQQQATLDRIVTARYDRPLERVIHPAPDNSMPDWAMSDQGEVRPAGPVAAAGEIGAGLAALHVESDAEFLEATD